MTSGTKGKAARVTKRAAARKPAKPKPKPKPRPKRAAKPTSTSKANAKPTRRAKAQAASARAASRKATRDESLGTITCPSGTLGIFDIGLFGYLPRPALEPAIVTLQVPADRELPVVGARVGRGRFADCWDHVAIQLGAGAIHGSKKLGEAGVDFARLVCVDHGSLDEWRHDDSLDGLADVMFWGRDEAALAKVMAAPRTREGYGWTNLPLAEAEAKLLEAERLKAEHKWLLAIDYRPHSHHFHALAAARANANGAGELELGGSRMLLFFTSWGDGVYPIYLDLDGDDQPVRVRIQLATEASNAAMRAVNP